MTDTRPITTPSHRPAPLRATITALAVAVMCAAAFTGCSGSGSDGAEKTPTTSANPKQQILDSVQRTRKVRNATFTTALNGGVEADTFSVEAQGALDQEHNTGRVHLRSEQSGDSTEVEVRLDGDTVYVKSSSLDLPDGKKWGRLSSADAKDADLFDVENLTVMDVALAFAGASDVHAKGTSTQFGDAVIEYEATIDLSKAMQALSSDDAEALESAFHINGVDADVTGSIWIDGDGYVRRVKVHGELNGTDGQLDAESTMTDIGKEVDVDEPSSSEVTKVSVSELKEALGS